MEKEYSEDCQLRQANKGICFVIMPIGELNDYPPNHFRHVYEDLFAPAIEAAGYVPKRADEVRSSSMIQVNVVKDVTSAPMAICDLSSRNPNVLFELGIRQAFDLPVVLVQEEGTPRIFDINTINTIDYGKELVFRNVMEEREKIRKAILATEDRKQGINSIIKLLDIEKANVEPDEKLTPQVQMLRVLETIRSEVSSMRYELDSIKGSHYMGIKLNDGKFDLNKINLKPTDIVFNSSSDILHLNKPATKYVSSYNLSDVIIEDKE